MASMAFSALSFADSSISSIVKIKTDKNIGELKKDGDFARMKESILNHDLVALFKSTGHFAYKIPDPAKSQVLSSSKRPFDGFARFSGPVNDFWFESKLMKNKISAFALDRVNEHQYASLLQIKRSGGLTSVILGVWIPRRDYWFLCFDPEFLFDLISRGKKSINRSELNFYRESGYSISLRNTALEEFSPETLRNRIVDFLPDWGEEVGKIQR
jgi:penicillin-binding protein-related factor A (putative recombinase)